MADEGLIDSSPGRAFHQMGGVPKVTVLRVSQVDDSGTVWAVPEQWHAETPPPKLRIVEGGRRRRARASATASCAGPRKKATASSLTR